MLDFIPQYFQWCNAFRYPSNFNIGKFGTGNGRSTLSTVLAALKENHEDYTLAAANRLYCQEGFALSKKYTDRIQKTFGAKVEQLDFCKNPAASAAEINKWVETITNGKITGLVSKVDFNGLTRLVLVNGVYFKGQWKDKFYELDTQKNTFYLNETETVQVDMMFQKAKFPYANLDKLNAHAVALPYKGDRLTMIIYAPHKIDGLNKIENALKTLAPSQVLDKFGTKLDVAVHLPKFKVECTWYLVGPLKALGAKAMFMEDSADFTGITNFNLRVSNIIQKAFIEVNEEGSEAAAATTLIQYALKSYKPLPKSHEFRADRPFYFQIVDRQTNFVLFAGTVSNPTI